MKILVNIRFLIVLLFSWLVGFCYSQQSIPWQQINEINRKIDRISCDREGAKPNRDGPIELEKWYDKNKRSRPSEFRILFLLKEAYGDDIQGLDLTKLRREESSLMCMDAGEGRPTYAPMVAIANMLVMNQQYDQVQINSTKAYTTFKECSAIVEVKKEYGTSKSSNSNIKRHARNNQKIIEEQIVVYNPNVVILCGNNIYENIFITHDVLGHKAFGVPANNVGQLRVNSKFSYYYNDHCIYINTYHPSSRVNKNDYCTEIVEAVRGWMEEIEK